MPVPSWGLVVPVKRLALAKTRLSSYGDVARQDLALAFALDVVTAALGAGCIREVVVVTDDPRAADAVTRVGARVVADAPDDGLNPALEHGASRLTAGLGTATLSADLPAVRAADLEAALAAVPVGGRGFVVDSAGTGTTLLAAAPGLALAAAYGPGSRDVHHASGAVELPGPAGLRLDVDTPDDLAAAVRLGVGAATAAVVRRLPRPSLLTVQATVRDWDARSRGGTVLLDNGRAVAFDGEAVQVRALRLGQRVQLRFDGERIAALTIVTLPLQ